MIVVTVELAVLVFFLCLERRNLKDLLVFKKPPVVKGLLVGLLYLAIIFASKQTNIGAAILKQFVGGIQLNWIELYFVYPVVIALSEEFVFRYFLPKRIGFILATVIFTMLHWRTNFPAALFVPVFLFGLSQSWLSNKTKSLWPPVIGHLMVTYSILFL